MQDLNDKVTGNQLQASEWNQPASELQNIIEAFGLTLSGAQLDQVFQCLKILNYQRGDCTVDVGASNATTFVVNYTMGAIFNPTSYVDGMRISFVATSGGAGTGQFIGIGGLATKPTRDRDDNIIQEQSSFWVTGRRYEFVFDASLDSWMCLTEQIGSEDFPGTYVRDTIAKLEDPLGQNARGAMTGLVAHRSAGWHEINKVLTSTVTLTEGAGLTTISDLTLTTDSYDPSGPSEQKFQFKVVLVLYNGIGTKDGSFFVSVSSQNLSTSDCHIRRSVVGDESTGNVKTLLSPKSTNFSLPTYSVVPDSYTDAVLSNTCLTIEGVLTASNAGLQLLVRVQHNGTGGNTVEVQPNSYSQMIKCLS